jgi:hypothetical protein
MRVKCLYCDSENDALATGGYCESCGKRLPSSAMIKPRRTLGGDAPAEPGETVPLPRKSKQTSEALIAVTVVYLVAGGLFLIVGPLLYNPVPEQFAPYVLTWTLLPAVVLGGLVVLARVSPQPSVLLGLALAVVGIVLSFVLYPLLAIGWLLVDVALIAMLLWAVWICFRQEKRAPG